MKWLWLPPVVVLEMIISLVEVITTSISGTLAVCRVWAMRDFSYINWLKRDLADCETILELGCGSNSPIVRIGYGKRTDTIEIFRPYVDKHNWFGDYRRCTEGDILKYDLPEKAFDAVVMLDVLEHLPRGDVSESGLFEKMERCARKKVILFTPNGFIENDLVDGDPHQAHQSAWEPEDYQKRGYTVRGTTGFRWILGKGSLPKYHPYNLIYIIAMLSLPIVFRKPTWAWHSYAVKELS